MGAGVGDVVGEDVGDCVGADDGAVVGEGVGEDVGDAVGRGVVGGAVGLRVLGPSVGESVAQNSHCSDSSVLEHVLPSAVGSNSIDLLRVRVPLPHPTVKPISQFVHAAHSLVRQSPLLQYGDGSIIYAVSHVVHLDV